jgi:hypothetical protein
VSFTDPSHYLGLTAQPAVEVHKLTNGVHAVSAPGSLILTGQPVNWVYQVANIGNIKLNNLLLRDNNGTPGNTSDDFTVCTITSLNTGNTQTCSAAGVATSGQYSNIATVTGTAQNGNPVSDTDTGYYFGASPAIQLTLRTNGSLTPTMPGVYVLQGATITWSYRVDNIGNVNLSSIQVIDDNGTPAISSDDISVCTIQTLAAGANQTCTLNGTAKAGQHTNVAYVVGTPPSGLSAVNDSDTGYYFGANLTLSLVKKANNQDANTAPGPIVLEGNPVDWSYLVTNGSNVTLTALVVVDDHGTPATTADDITVCTIPSLAAGNSQTCQLTGSASIGQYVNIGRVSGTPPGGLTAPSATDPAHYFGLRLQLSLVKRTNGQVAHTPPGPSIPQNSPVAWSYDVTNQSNVGLTNLLVKDDNGTPANLADDILVCTIPSLASGATTTCLENGVAVLGLYTNVGTVSAIYNTQPVSASDVSHYTGILPYYYLYLPWVKR